jgi:hypothetical protein
MTGGGAGSAVLRHDRAQGADAPVQARPTALHLPEGLVLAATNHLAHHDFLELLPADELARRAHTPT